MLDRGDGIRAERVAYPQVRRRSVLDRVDGIIRAKRVVVKSTAKTLTVEVAAMTSVDPVLSCPVLQCTLRVVCSLDLLA